MSIEYKSNKLSAMLRKAGLLLAALLIATHFQVGNAQELKYNGKTLGVLGGMGPAASAEFMRLMAVKAPATTDRQHPRIILYSNPQVPDRNAYIFGSGTDPEPFLLEGLEKLSAWGADVLCVTCNTAHYYIDHFRDRLDKPLVHIVDETVKAARGRSPQGAWLTATVGTMKSGLFQQHAAQDAYTFIEPSEDIQGSIQEVITLVKAGKFDESGKLLRKNCERLWKIRRLPIVAACTEIPIAYEHSGLPADMCISSLEALADACLRELYAPANKESFMPRDKMPDASVFLPAPPEPGSGRFYADSCQYEWGKTLRDTPRGKQALEDAAVSTAYFAKIFSAPMGMEISEEATPEIYNLIQRTIPSVRQSIASAKSKFHRARPFVYFKESPADPGDAKHLSPNSSYPSGHTIRGWSIALVLSQVNPDAKDALLVRGYEYGQSRVILGVHYQSDVDAARDAAGACVAALNTDDGFREQLMRARQEFERISAANK